VLEFDSGNDEGALAPGREGEAFKTSAWEYTSEFGRERRESL
jgi:hypothetical protein